MGWTRLLGFSSEEIDWCNGGLKGCGGGESSVKADTVAKSNFGRAIEIVNELAKMGN